MAGKRTFVTVLVLAVLVAVAFFAWQSHVANYDKDHGNVSGDMPEAIRIPGGVLEVATLKKGRAFNLDRPIILGPIKIPYCPEKARVELTAHFTYRVALAKTFPARIENGKLKVQVPKLEPSLPVAWNTGTLRTQIDKCWFLPGRNTTDILVRDISRRLATEASSPAYIGFAENNGARETVREFVRTWLLKQQDYTRLPSDIPIEVTFGGQ